MTRPINLRFSPLVVAVLFTLLLAALVLIFTPPFWETNDDFAMATYTGGRGSAAVRTPGVVFSNILFGWAVSATPDMFDRASYDLISYALNLVAIAAICYALLSLLQHKIVALIIVGVIAQRMLIFPQFTLLAGGLAIGGFLLIRVYAANQQGGALVVAGLLLFLSFLVRREMFLFVLLLAIVVMADRRIVVSRPVQVTVGIAAMFIIAAMIGHHLYYSQSAWAPFVELNTVRSLFTDFGAVGLALERPDLLRKTGFSANDIAMLGGWWLIDPDIASPERLRRLVGGLPASGWLSGNYDRAFSEVLGLGDAGLLNVLVPAAFMTVLARNPARLGLGWCTILAACFMISLMGRYSVTRIYYPLFAFMLCLGAVSWRTSRHWRVVTAALLAAMGWTGFNLLAHHRTAERSAALVHEDMKHIDFGRLHVVWGAAFPFELAYPLFTPVSEMQKFRWYGLGTLTTAPFMIPKWNDGRVGLIDELLNGKPISIFSTDGGNEALRTWCAEHHHRALRIDEVDRLNTMKRYTLTCRQTE